MKYLSISCYTIFIFLAGYGTAHFQLFSEANTSNSAINAVSLDKSLSASPKTSIENKLLPEITLNNASDLAKLSKNNFTLDKLSEVSLRTAVETAELSEITETLGLFFKPDELNEFIVDARVFASRLVEELGESDPQVHPESLAEIKISQSKKAPSEDQYYFSLATNTRLFAHINLNGAIGYGDSKLFIKWKNSDSGQLLLFEQKNMNANSDLNWVSYQPNRNWEKGNYEVIFYRFTSQMEVLATKQFYIDLAE